MNYSEVFLTSCEKELEFKLTFFRNLMLHSEDSCIHNLHDDVHALITHYLRDVGQDGDAIIN
jgi:hypothetical protein